MKHIYIFPESFLKKNMKFGVLGRVCFAGRFVPGVWMEPYISRENNKWTNVHPQSLTKTTYTQED